MKWCPDTAHPSHPLPTPHTSHSHCSSHPGQGKHCSVNSPWHGAESQFSVPGWAGRLSPEVAGEGVLLDHVLTPRDKTLLSGWVWEAKCCNGDRQLQINPCKASSQSWHAPPGPGDFPRLDLHRANPAVTRGQLELGWPRAPALLLPSHLTGQGLSVQP